MYLLCIANNGEIGRKVAERKEGGSREEGRKKKRKRKRRKAGKKIVDMEER